VGRYAVDGHDDVAGVEARFGPAAFGIRDADAETGVIAEDPGIDADVGKAAALRVFCGGLVVLNFETEEVEISGEIDGFALIEVFAEEAVHGGVVLTNDGSGAINHTVGEALLAGAADVVDFLHERVDGVPSFGGVTDKEIETGAEQLALEMGAGGIITEG